MIKIFLTCRNRLAITKKCIESIRRHTKTPYQLYVFDNQTNYKFGEHASYLLNLFQKGIITQLIFNSDTSTFNAFSKASACNQFGTYHQQDPEKNEYEFLLMLDNDIILTPGWDKKISITWNFVKRYNLNNVKVVGQYPGGIKGKKELVEISNKKQNIKFNGRIGKLGGSGLWSVKPNFFTEVGLLDLKQLVRQNKKHDQLYWRLLETSAKGRSYILGIQEKLGIHCGSMTGSVCNVLTNRKISDPLEQIKFTTIDKQIDNYNFEDFYNKITNDKFLINDW